MSDWPEEFTPEMGDDLVKITITVKLDKIHGEKDFTTISEIDIVAGDDTPSGMALACAISSTEGALEEMRGQYKREFGDPAGIKGQTTRKSEQWSM